MESRGCGHSRACTKPGGAVVQTVYSGNTATTTDEAGVKRKSATDALGRVTNVWESDESNQLVYETVYDLGGHPKPANEGHLKTGQ
jgi:hypothetical protein